MKEWYCEKAEFQPGRITIGSQRMIEIAPDIYITQYFSKVVYRLTTVTK